MSDLISRQAAIDALKKQREYIDMTLKDGTKLPLEIRRGLRHRRGQNVNDIEVIENLPSVEPERKRGKWIIDRHGNWACDQCGNDPYHCNMENMNFCPNCGAWMKGVKEA